MALHDRLTLLIVKVNGAAYKIESKSA